MAAPGEEEGDADIVRGNGEKILIVDDETELLDSMENLLSDIGYRTASTNSGSLVLDIYKSWRPDVVLMDRNMPEMDGTGYAKKILAFDPAARIILVSGYEKFGPNGIADTESLLIMEYLTKPVDVNKLSRVLRRLLNHPL